MKKTYFFISVDVVLGLHCICPWFQNNMYSTWISLFTSWRQDIPICPRILNELKPCSPVCKLRNSKQVSALEKEVGPSSSDKSRWKGAPYGLGLLKLPCKLAALLTFVSDDFQKVVLDLSQKSKGMPQICLQIIKQTSCIQ